MLTASELCKKKELVRKEKKYLEERIEKASESDSEAVWDAQGIVSPFTPYYEVSPATRQWLEEYGWRFEDDHIRAIHEEEHYIP